ncbi:hypothetical protein CEXT_182011 [Caerostris extrusa]|uniref:Uncharacterized protein n=1 Tax=Caerostris extrusa TaxID=172846 RepID=A0AAV4Y3A9_CAEEX|nr:hypothetical protein CEXT_182011 [Caerostris extrusa]
MERRNCEFCNAYITNFEVHSCRNVFNQHRLRNATLPRSGNRAEGTDSRLTQRMNSGALWPTTSQINSPTQQSILPNILQLTHFEETAAAEMSSPYRIAKWNEYIPEVSDCLFANMPQVEENQSETTHLQQPPEMFGQKNPWENQIAENPSASSQMERSGISRTDEMPSHFISDFIQNDIASTSRISQHNETSLGIPILAVENVQHNPMDPIPHTDTTGPIHSNKCPTEFLPKDHPEPQDISGSVARPYSYWKNTSAASTLGKNYINAQNVVNALLSVPTSNVTCLFI